MGHGNAAKKARPRWIGLLGAVLASALLAACLGKAPPPPTPMPSPPPARVDHCGVGLVPDAYDLGFRSAAMSPAAGELVVDALLIADASGGYVLGRPITYAARLRGALPGVHPPSGQLVLEAQRAADSGTDCVGSIRMLLTAETQTQSVCCGEAIVTGSLKDSEVRAGSGFGPFCSAVSNGDGTISVECPLAGVRQADTSTDGILRLRVGWSGTPGELASPPGWAADLLAAVPTPAPQPTVPQSTWAVTGDHPGLTANPGGIGGGSATIRAEAGTIRYLVKLPVIHHADLDDFHERPGTMYVSISPYTGPGEYGPEAITGRAEVRAEPGPGGGASELYYTLANCHATIGAAEDAGQLDCAIGPGNGGETDPPTSLTGHLTATWQTSTLGRDVGPAVELTWRLGGHYVNQGTATVYLPAVAQGDAGTYHVPDVRVGGPAANPETLRISIAPFMGDGTYTGDAVLAALDNVTGTSPNVVLDGRPPWPDLWQPAFGECQAILREAGQSGEISCPGAPPSSDMFPGGTTTLEASWRIEP